MFIQTAFSFSGVIQCLFCLFSGLRLHGLRRFSVFLASSPCVASASSYRFCSAVPPRWRSVFSRLAPVAKFKLSVLASGSLFIMIYWKLVKFYMIMRYWDY
ncbi:TPA: DUF1010 domain-containing protein [Klebsiella pneumoniae]